MQIKVCSKCALPLPLKMFHKLKHGALGRHPNCKTCRSKYESKRWKGLPGEHKRRLRKSKGKSERAASLAEFGFTLESFRDAVTAVDGKCEICSKYVGDSLCVDHCHSSGKFRGLLCSTCNMGLGMFRDDEERLRKAIKYLRSRKNGRVAKTVRRRPAKPIIGSSILPSFSKFSCARMVKLADTQA